MRSVIYYYDEIYTIITQDMVPGVCINRYWVSNYGNVYDTKYKRFVSLWYSSSEVNYLNVTLRKEDGGFIHVGCHRLVALGFIPGGPMPTVNHKNGAKYDNDYKNLEWATTSENLQHAIDTGLKAIGPDHYSAKLTEDMVRKACEGILENKSYKEILESIGLELNDKNRSLIYDLKRGRSYKNIISEYGIEHTVVKNANLFTSAQIRTMAKYIRDNPNSTDEEILSILNLENPSNKDKLLSNIRRMRNREIYCHEFNKYN